MYLFKRTTVILSSALLLPFLPSTCNAYWAFPTCDFATGSWGRGGKEEEKRGGKRCLDVYSLFCYRWFYITVPIPFRGWRFRYLLLHVRSNFMPSESCLYLSSCCILFSCVLSHRLNPFCSLRCCRIRFAITAAHAVPLSLDAQLLLWVWWQTNNLCEGRPVCCYAAIRSLVYHFFY